jgi:hypothetical protein
MRKFLIISLLGVALVLPGLALARGNNYINPNEGKCNVQLPPDASPVLYRDGGNRISYNMDYDTGIVEATCHFKNSGLDLDRAWVFTADDYDFDYYCRIKIDDIPYMTLDYRVTLTPSGNVNMTCTAEMDIVSDYRLKEDVTLLQELDNGIKLYSFNYKWSDETFVGVMAQDLLIDPNHLHAVKVRDDQFYVVNYTSLGLRMVTLDQWKKSRDSVYLSPDVGG